MTLPSAAGNFELASNDAAFGARKKDIFATLDTIEAKHVAFENTKSADNSALLKPDPAEEELMTLSKVKNPPPTFKVPSPASGFSRKRKNRPIQAPGHLTNPKKWKKYDLSDVPNDQLSERQNTAAAFDFLNSLKPSGASSASSDVSGSDGNVKHIFRKPTKSLNATDSNQTPPIPSTLSKKMDATKDESDDIDESDDPDTFLRLIPTPSMPDVVPRNCPSDDMEVDSNSVFFRSAKLRSKDRHVRNKDSDSGSDDDVEISKPAKNSECVPEEESDDDSDDFGEFLKPSDDDGDDEEMVENISDKEEVRAMPCVLRSLDKNEELDLDEVD